MGRALVIVGLLIVGIGLLVMAGLPLGRLPGDVIIRRGNSVIYIPIVTCLVLSVLLTVLFSLFRR